MSTENKKGKEKLTAKKKAFPSETKILLSWDLDNPDFQLQYSSLLLVIFVVETSMLVCGYLYREDLTKSFHAGLGNGLQLYGKDSAQTAAVDDIQSTVSFQATPLLLLLCLLYL